VRLIKLNETDQISSVAKIEMDDEEVVAEVVLDQSELQPEDSLQPDTMIDPETEIEAEV
jgi:DNA gyrase subunit A